MKRIKTHDGRRLTARQLMEEVKVAIVTEPKCYNQQEVLFEVDGNEKPTCGTPACIAGWMSHIIFNNQKRSYQKVHETVTGVDKWPWLFDARFNHGPEEVSFKSATSGTACHAIDLYMAEHPEWFGKS